MKGTEELEELELRSCSMKTLLEVFQVCDSTFPIGTFNHSFGMENYLHRRAIRKAPAFEKWITNYFRSQYRYGEGLLTILCFRAMEEEKETALHKMLRYDDIITKSTLASETRDGTKMIARQMYILIRRISGDTIPYLQEYAELVEEEKAFGNPAIVFSMFAHEKGISQKDVFEMYGYSVASTLVQNAVRSVPLGQREGQVILKKVIDLICSLYPKSVSLTEDSLGANAPGLELAQIAHETQPARLFMS